MIDIVSTLAVSAAIVLLALVFYALFRILRVGEKSTEFKNGMSLEEYEEDLATPSQKDIPKFRQFLIFFVPLPLLMLLVGNSFLCILTLIVVFFISIDVISNRVRTLLTTFEKDYMDSSSWETLKERKERWRVRKRRVTRWDIIHYKITRKAPNFSEFKRLVLSPTVKDISEIMHACKSLNVDVEIIKTELRNHHKDILEIYESECFKEKKVSAEEIFSELESIEDFGLWTERFRYYALVAKDLPLIERWINRCFDFKIGLPIALFSALVFFTARLLHLDPIALFSALVFFRAGLLHLDWEITFLLLGSFYFGCAFLFGLIAIVLSVLCANIGVPTALACMPLTTIFLWIVGVLTLVLTGYGIFTGVVLALRARI